MSGNSSCERQEVAPLTRTSPKLAEFEFVAAVTWKTGFQYFFCEIVGYVSAAHAKKRLIRVQKIVARVTSFIEVDSLQLI